MASKMEAALKKAKSETFRNFIIKSAETISDLGVSNETDLRRLHHIAQFVPVFVRRATGSLQSNDVNARISEYIFEKYPRLNSVAELSSIVIEALADENVVSRRAYVNMPFFDYEPIQRYDTNKWIQTANDIYLKMRLMGQSEQQLIAESTKGWNEMETNKFKDWLRFYEEGGHLAYKMAGMNKHALSTTENGVTLPFTIAPVPGMPDPNVGNKGGPVQSESQFLQQQQEQLEKDLADKKMEKQEARNKIRTSIVGRINSAKRLLSSELGREFVGSEYPKLLTSILALEKEILSLNSDLLTYDLIVRAENMLRYDGFVKSAAIMKKISQDMGLETSPEGGKNLKDEINKTIQEVSAGGVKMPTAEELKKKVMQKKQQEEVKPAPLPSPASPPSPTASGAPASPEAPPPPPPAPIVSGASSIPAWANHKTPELSTLEVIAEYIGSIAKTARTIIRTAQIAPAPGLGTAEPKKGNGFFPEDSLDKAFENITIQDVTKRLQALSKVFKNREIARQLSIIDLMLDKLGIAGLFPQLAEATKSALESNQYSSIRIEEVLNKLMSVIDENGNVNVNIINNEEESLVDKEMADALKQGDAVAAGNPAIPPSPQIPEPTVTTGPAAPKVAPPPPKVEPIPPPIPGV